MIVSDGQHGTATPPPPVPGSVLVVEDDLKLAWLIDRALERVGLEAEVVGDGDSALRAMREHPSEAVVLDIMIPHPDGIEVCRQLRRNGWTGPVLMISARSSEADQQRSLAAGADLFLAKPFPLLDLARAVQGSLSAPPEGDGGPPTDPGGDDS